MALPMYKWLARAAIIPVIVIGYVSIAGLTGVCPISTGIMDSVLGRDGAPILPVPPGEPKGSITELTAYTISGDPVSLAKYVGKPLIIDVWATWCPPCRKQRDIIHKLDAEFLKTVTIVSLSNDNDPRLVESFLKKHPSETIDLMATKELLDELGKSVGKIESIPTLLFIDAQGRIRDVAAGVQSARELRQRVQGLLE
ncbi:MAG: TlpA family protein disulfide reductase [Pyrinomonadaceae bacterium]|nr:TlpA family protein disulfide reductase [Phycisphaerales bacterium]